MEFHSDDEPIYVISVAARLVEMHPQTLRYYELAGLRKISRLTNELGVNLAGVEIIIDLTERLELIQERMKQRETILQTEIEKLKREVQALQHIERGGV